ncbi:MAG: PHP domain-containing protein [Deltaproteobacteria bacterium]|uniref:PHP domain-containing protein n=1 Tax=Candidatus Zymogenus saltonus TaxID=2844893 RepID=A0A9D8PNK0_9DELT|nr:PHP domain-containing protein [Candidatus Zymogenus saltonus]
MIDLHTHTTASDGTLTPEQLIRHAHEIGISAISVTDHDTTDGVAIARTEAEKRGVFFIQGIEISAEYSDQGTMHILGYFIDENNDRMIEVLDFLKRSRRLRNPKMIKLLNEAGISITMEDVVNEAGGGQVGRPHFARTMIKKGFASSINEVFDKYIKKGGPCYVNKERLSPEKSIELILTAGGIPVIAHPKTLGVSDHGDLKKLIIELMDYGLMGMECYYFSHTKAETEGYIELAEELGLLVTGGTDFHGENKPNIRLGVGKGDLKIPDDLAEKLKAAHEKMVTGKKVEGRGLETGKRK